MKKLILFFFVAVGMSTMSMAQIQTPAPSPMCKMEQMVGLTKVTLEYSRPSVKGRQVFGDLVPYGQMWRTGANASTKITFDKDVKMNGFELAAGTYALYTIPNENDWTVIFHNNLEYWGTGGEDYSVDEDALRLNAKPSRLGHMVETFTIDINNIRNGSAHLVLMWENTMVEVPFEVNTLDQVQESIDAVMAGPSGRDYYSAAQFYLAEGLDMDKAIMWVDEAIASGYDGFWVLKLKSEIQAEMGDYKAAIETAKASKASAMEAGNDGYVKMNNANIEKWMKM